ncbi:MAG: ABC transporter ATP-binding protein [Lachnospiraceae bacterium]|nr:ABC transporter ATP-binding protein [Lachnospiraceae bacterium]
MIIAEVRNLKKIYTAGTQKTAALNGVDLSVQEGEFVSVVGASGSGKTTLLHLLGALDEPSEGTVRIRGHEISKLEKEERIVFRRRNIGFVFQNYNLIPVLNVYENIVLPLELDGRSIDSGFLEFLLGRLGLEDKKDRMPNTLSGGQQQRVAISRALITKPALLLADEPTGNLDSKTGMEVIGLMKTLSEKLHQTLIVVTHNDEIAQLADRIVRIEDGRIGD